MKVNDAASDIELPPSWFPAAVFAVAVIAIGLRFIGLFEWALWEDEEGTIFFANHLDQPFARFFPVYFVVLKTVFAFTGPSIIAARSLAAAVGLLSLFLVYRCFRQPVGRVAALLAVALLAINLGHLFWSQSVRYYTLALCFQIISLGLFLDGFERGRAWKLTAANLLFALALLTHFSAVLLLPVYIAFLVVAALIFGRKRYALSSYLWFCVPLVLVTALFAMQIRRSQGMMGSWVIPSARDPIHVITTVIAYFGVPLVSFGTLAVVRTPKLTTTRLLLACIALVPIAELLVITELNIINVAWYYALIALVGLALLSADWMVDLYRRQRRRASFSLAAASVVYAVAWLVPYFTSAVGDRPRWREATALVASEGSVRYGSSSRTTVFATAPQVVAYYLGVPDGARYTQKLVQRPLTAPRLELGEEEWYVIPAFEISDTYQAWFRTACSLRGDFPARLGFRDRSVKVYRCEGTQVAAGHS